MRRKLLTCTVHDGTNGDESIVVCVASQSRHLHHHPSRGVLVHSSAQNGFNFKSIPHGGMDRNCGVQPRCALRRILIQKYHHRWHFYLHQLLPGGDSYLQPPTHHFTPILDRLPLCASKSPLELTGCLCVVHNHPQN